MVIEGYLSDIMKKFGYNISGETKNLQAISEHYKWFNFRKKS